MAKEIKYHVPAWARRVGIRNRDLAAGAKITKGYVSGLLSGKKHPSDECAARLAAAMGISIEELRYPPGSTFARAVAALHRVQPAKQETVVEMIEGAANKGGGNE